MASQNVEDRKGELRQQGAIETAQEASKDPQSGLRPEAVEKVLIEETRKAGLPAYQFNPDASPEEKAAAAAAVSFTLILSIVVVGKASLISLPIAHSEYHQVFTMTKSPKRRRLLRTL